MFILSRWIQKWREERRLVKVNEAREAERRIQHEKRDHQQAQARLLTLYELERTMDPLIAAQVYNNRFCPFLSRLPEELLLCILEFLSDDAVALHCLRIVSRTFLRLLNYQTNIWKDAWHDDRYSDNRTFHLHHVPRLRFRRLLQRDGRCDNCKRWNDAFRHRTFDDCKFMSDPTFCRTRTLYCHACKRYHDVCQFSSANQRPWMDPSERRCLGQQGRVYLCEHVHITWANIKDHIDNWRQKQQDGGGDWQSCLDSFSIECHDTSHDMRCIASEDPTWPLARLRNGTWNKNIVVLCLEWKPHCRLDTLTLTADGRIPAPELRAQFRRLRRLGPADTLYPPCRPGFLPEMACFSPSSRPSSRTEPIIHYNIGEDDVTGSPSASIPPFHAGRWRYLNDHFGGGRNGKMLKLGTHCLRASGFTGISWQCLVVSYKKDIMVCRTRALTDPTVDITPTYRWLHAMDTDTYPHPHGSHIRPQCKDEACTNYYRRLKEHCHCYP